MSCSLSPGNNVCTKRNERVVQPGNLHCELSRRSSSTHQHRLQRNKVLLDLHKVHTSFPSQLLSALLADNDGTSILYNAAREETGVQVEMTSRQPRDSNRRPRQNFETQFCYTDIPPPHSCSSTTIQGSSCRKRRETQIPTSYKNDEVVLAPG
ncbi:hypothetical protein Mapa_000673 [Marchantia paleacea]|nr:hypothetical protein Mapa_000673 [Marchantia paleacea]